MQPKRAAPSKFIPSDQETHAEVQKKASWDKNCTEKSSEIENIEKIQEKNDETFQCVANGVSKINQSQIFNLFFPVKKNL